MEECKTCIYYGEYISKNPISDLPYKVKMGCVHPVADMYVINPADIPKLDRGCASRKTQEEEEEDVS